jgi:uncharacterized membrane protein YfcA
VIDAPLFYPLAALAIVITGMSKGGFGSTIGGVTVPLMSLAIAPTQAAAITLPILCLMDVGGLWAYWGKWSAVNLRILVGAALIGIAIGAASFRYLNDDAIRLLIGAIAVGFTLSSWHERWRAAPRPDRGPNLWRGGFWGALSGFTSFTAHAGGPPVNVYLLPQRLQRTTHQATTVCFFGCVNYMKLAPYFWLGQFTAENLKTSAVLMPVAMASIWFGIWLHSRINDRAFYAVCTTGLFLTGLKLLYDGARGLL